MQAQGQFITLRDRGEAKAVVAPDLGGWLLRYLAHTPQFGYVDVLFYDQAAVDRYPRQMYTGNPLLFPLVSFNHLEGREHHYQWQEAVYSMPQHGFARCSRWKVVKASETSVTIELTSTEQTRKQFPFGFRHRVTYELKDHRLHFRQSIENTSSKVMPLSTGIHPYFPLPMIPGGKRENCFVELPACRRISSFKNWESWTAEACPALRLDLREDFSGTAFFTDLEKPEISMVDPAANLKITVDLAEAPQYRFLALWSRSPDAPFFCIEPWTALPNSFSRPDTELILLDPGRKFEASLSIRLERAEALG